MSKINFNSDLAHNPIHYFSLICILAVGLWGVSWFGYDKTLQLSLVVSLGVTYTVWGIIHHAIHKDLHPKIVVEYVLMSILAILVIGSLVFQA